jgi:uncharacterized protein YbjT (DUF2867 family)
MRTFRSILVCCAAAASTADAFSASVAGSALLPRTAETSASSTTRNVLTTVAVTGATGRTGRLVVQELLNRGIPNVLAIVRNETKAADVFKSQGDVELDGGSSSLRIVQCDLTNDMDIASALQGADAAIWCATGFSDAQPPPPQPKAESSPFSVLAAKVKALLGLEKESEPPKETASVPRKSIDLIGLPAVAKCMLNKESESPENNAGNAGSDSRLSPPRVVMLSSAGVTRPAWDEKKRSLFSGAADIPIVRLNPFGILDLKRQSEEALRASGVPYCIVRPAGLNDDWPAGSRPVLSQGDVAVGRIHRRDVAAILVEALLSPAAAGKTFEAISVAGYPGGAATLGQAMARLRLDMDGPMSFDSTYATYSAM